MGRKLPIVTLIVSLLLATLGAGTAGAAAQWHNKMIRSAWERDMQEIGGDGTQIPRAMVYSPKNGYQTIFFGVDTAGVYRSDDGGQTWTSKMKGIKMPFIKSLAVDPGNPDVVYALAAYERWDTPDIGLYISVDNGENWTQQRYFKVTTPPENTHVIAIDPTSYSATLGRCAVVYVGANDGLYKTTDGGVIYAKVGTASIGSRTVTSVDVHQADSDIVTVATYDGVFRSDDAGASFTDISLGLPTVDDATAVPIDTRINALAVDPSDADTMYAIFDDPVGKAYKVFKKTAADASWRRLTNGVPPNNEYSFQSGRFYDIVIHPDAPNKLLLGVEWDYPHKGPFYSDDYGETWVDSNAGKVIEDRFNLGGGDIANNILFRSAFAPKPDDGDTWLAAMNYGAIFKTTDSAATWRWSNTNYGGARFSKFAFNPNDSRHIVAGGTDMGVVTSFDGGQSFKRSQVEAAADSEAVKALGTNVTTLAVDPDSATPETARVIASAGGTNPNLRGALRVSQDGGRTFAAIEGTIGYQASNIMWHPSDHDYIYAGQFVSGDDGASWKGIVHTRRLSETFESTAVGALPADWSVTVAGTAGSDADVQSVSGNKKLRLAISQTSPKASVPTATYGAMALDFDETPITATGTIEPGTTAGTSQSLLLDNGAGSSIAATIVKNAGGTYSTKYRIKDGSYDSGEVVIQASSSSAVTTRITVSKDYIIVNCGQAVVIPYAFGSRTGFKLALSAASDAVGSTVYAYANDVTYSMLPIDVVGYSTSDPDTLYAYDGLNLYKSTDFADSWTKLITHVSSDPDVGWLYSNYITAAEMNGAGTKIYMGHRDGVYIYDIATNTETFKSVANGFVNNQSGSLDVTHIAIDPSDDTKIYAGEFNLIAGNGEWVFKSEDAGLTWTRLNGTGFFGNGKVWGLDVDGAGRLFAGSDHGTFWYGDLAPPAAPSGVTAVSESGAVRLNWSAVSGAQTYQVKRSASAGGPFAVIAGGVVGTTWLDAAVEPAVTYYYQISAGNLAGEGTGSTPVAGTAWLYETGFGAGSGALPPEWSYTGSPASSAAVSGGQLRHSLNPTAAWNGTSRVTLANHRFEYYSAPLLVEAYLDPGTKPIGQSGIQVGYDDNNYVYVLEKTDRGVIYRVKDGSYDSGELLAGTFTETTGTIRVKLSPDGVVIYRNGSTIATVNHNMTYRSDLKLSLLGRSGTVDTDIGIYADNVKAWKATYSTGFSGSNGTLPPGWTNVVADAGQGTIQSGALRLQIVQPSGFAKHTVLRKTDSAYALTGTDKLNVEAYLKADAFSGTATQVVFGLAQRDRPNQNQFYIVVQNNGYVGYRIVDPTGIPDAKVETYDTGEVKIGDFAQSYGVFRLEATDTSLLIYRNGVLIKSVAWNFTNKSGYQASLVGRSSTASSMYYVTADDVNVYRAP
ncbi:hypothetical protein [Cohnella sp. GCM10012308]|uniref:hypothetical protein n=1 Tax=Cohnella sp. GCM10012308 TaxID=3317329 RepID=UPI00361700BA